MGKTFKIVFSSMSIPKIYSAILDNDLEVTDKIIEFLPEYEDDIKSICDCCKELFISQTTDQTDGYKVVTKGTEPRACVFEYDETGEISCAYEINNLLSNNSHRVIVWDGNDLRREIDILEVKELKGDILKFLGIMGLDALSVSGSLYEIGDILIRNYQLDNKLINVPEHKAMMIKTDYNFIPWFSGIAGAGTVLLGVCIYFIMKKRKAYRKIMQRLNINKG